MQLGFYHYYFKKRKTRNAPRIIHDLRPIIKAYIKYDNIDWKKNLEIESGEKLFLIPTKTKHIYMLVATRQQEIIKAISTSTLSCTDIQKRLKKDESTGFAAYFQVHKEYIALASTLRGPRTAAFYRFINHILSQLGAQNWKFEIEPVGSSITLEQAKGLAFVSSTKIRVGPKNSVFAQLNALFSGVSDDINSYEVIVRGKKNRNLKEVFDEIAKNTTTEDLKKMTVRAKEHVQDALIDYHVEAEGKFTKDIGVGTEEQITKKIKIITSTQEELEELIENVKKGNVYNEQLEITQLSAIGNVKHWHKFLSNNGEDSTEDSNTET